MTQKRTKRTTRMGRPLIDLQRMGVLSVRLSKAQLDYLATRGNSTFLRNLLVENMRHSALIDKESKP